MEPNEKEEFVIVLDFLPNGYPFDSRPNFRKTPIAQVISKKNFTLLEIIPKKDVTITAMEELYIGEGKREKVHHVVGRIGVDRLTQTAKGELEFVVEKLVKENPQKFLDFFNKCGPISTRMHQIELLPGIGKKHMWAILEKREEKTFESFEEIKERISAIPDPVKIFVRRVMMELNNEDKYKIFAR
jgi:putative nucleotide binding protein